MTRRRFDHNSAFLALYTFFDTNDSVVHFAGSLSIRTTMEGDGGLSGLGSRVDWHAKRLIFRTQLRRALQERGLSSSMAAVVKLPNGCSNEESH